MKNVPQKIWLQVGDESIQLEPHDDFNQCHEVTWCKDKIFDADIPYVLAKSGPGRFVPDEAIKKFRKNVDESDFKNIYGIINDFLQAIEKTEEK